MHKNQTNTEVTVTMVTCPLTCRLNHQIDQLTQIRFFTATNTSKRGTGHGNTGLKVLRTGTRFLDTPGSSRILRSGCRPE